MFPITFFGHPVHPAVVHFPIALFVLHGFLLLLRLVTKNPKYDDFAYLSLRLGFLSLLLAVPAGVNDAKGISAVFEEPAMSNHALVGLSLPFVYGFAWFLRKKFGLQVWDGKILLLYLASAVIGMVLVGIAGYLGAFLVYE